MSPEAIEAPVGMSRLKIGRASDVWSLGCIFYQMVYGAPPFQAYNMPQKMRIIPDDSWKIQYRSVSVPIIPAHKTLSGQSEKDEENSVPVPACFIMTMERCLERDPKKRATIPELLAEEWVNTVLVARLKEDEVIVNKHYLLQVLHHAIGQYHQQRVPLNIPFRNDNDYQTLLDEVADVSELYAGTYNTYCCC
jgi:serine/threonine-protein kinase TTK/MPS1